MSTEYIGDGQLSNRIMFPGGPQAGRQIEGGSGHGGSLRDQSLNYYIILFVYERLPLELGPAISTAELATVALLTPLF